MDTHLTFGRAKNRFFPDLKLRPGQISVLEKMADGGDVLAVMPTGYGKSLCYQLPGMSEPGITLIISPLIALMDDQVRSLRSIGCSAIALHSGFKFSDPDMVRREIRQGKYRFVFMSPERFCGEGFVEFAASIKLQRIVIDEAHCLSLWGHDFRPAYLDVSKCCASIEALQGRKIPKLALTATASGNVVADIQQQLGITAASTIRIADERNNIFLSVDIVSRKNDRLFELLADHAGKRTVVFCSSVKSVTDVMAVLRRAGYSADQYHGRLTPLEKSRAIDGFIVGSTSVMVATSALGLGVDIPEISVVIHYHCPASVESYVQEIGRAGRDGAEAFSYLLFSFEDRDLHEYLIGRLYPPFASLRSTQMLLAALTVNDGLCCISPSDLSLYCPDSISISEARCCIDVLSRFGLVNFSVAGDGKLEIEDVALNREIDRSDYERKRQNSISLLDSAFALPRASRCRRSEISRYFGFNVSLACGNCDQCISRVAPVVKSLDYTISAPISQPLPRATLLRKLRLEVATDLGVHADELWPDSLLEEWMMFPPLDLSEMSKLIDSNDVPPGTAERALEILCPSIS